MCDEPLAPGATFCPRCGTRVEDAAQDDAAQGNEAMTGLVVDDPTAAPGATLPDAKYSATLKTST